MRTRTAGAAWLRPPFGCTTHSTSLPPARSGRTVQRDCSEGGASPPKVTLPAQVEGRPISEERKACAQYSPPEGASETDDTGVQLCNEAERVDMMATPDPKTGHCRVGQTICVDGGQSVA